MNATPPTSRGATGGGGDANGSASRERWLVAAWPGMGSVGDLAVRHLIRLGGGERVLEMDPAPWFDLGKIRVKDGIVRSDRGPSTSFHLLLAPAGAPHDAVALVADAQPARRSRAHAESVVEAALGLGVSRVVTFAALAAQVEPSAPARVFAAATAPRFLQAAVARGAIPLQGGEIGGMNGSLLAAAARRGLDALCLLGEFPYFATALPNPKAAASVLRVFAGVFGAAIDPTELDRQGRIVEGELVSFLEGLSRREREARAAPEASFEDPISDEPTPATETSAEAAGTDRARIERLFAEADGERSKCLALKAELDRLGLFAEYEDRFLDLFRHGE